MARLYYFLKRLRLGFSTPKGWIPALSSVASLDAAPSRGRFSGWRLDALISIAAALVVLCVQASSGFPTLTSPGGDNDSLLRLVEVRDLIAGQGWFDLHQYRMGPEGGFVMHWSRLVDAPIAAIVLAIGAIAGSQVAGETAAMLIWPLGLYAAALFLLLRIARRLAGEEIVLPALVIGGISLYFTGIFVPGALDHHNVQLVLTLAMLLCLVKAGPGNHAGFAAGVLAVLMLAVGMETVPFVAVGGIVVAIWFLIAGAGVAGIAAGFGIAFATASAIVLLATVPSAEWIAVRCDSFSVTHFALGALAGCGLAGVALTPALGATPGARAISLAALGAVTAGIAVAFFPQCLADPYASMDPTLKRYLLNAISEAQPLWVVLPNDPKLAIGHYATPLVALTMLACHLRRNGLRREEIIVAAFLIVALLVSIWQIRGFRFSIPLACLPLAAWVADIRQRAQAAPGGAASLKLAGAWLASLNIVWIALATVLSLPFAAAAPEEIADVLSAKRCERRQDYATLAKLPPTTVLAITNLGAMILVGTPHRVLAGPYHRNVDGDLAMINAFMGSREDAAAVIRKHRVGLVAVCRGNDETEALVEWAPSGFMAELIRNDVPDWLDVLPETAGQPLQIYRVGKTP